MKEIILRDEYLQILKDFKDKDIIKVVTGIRRCGKTTLIHLVLSNFAFLKSGIFPAVFE